MSEAPPIEPDANIDTNKAKKAGPSFVFVDNSTERLLALRRNGKAPKGTAPPQEETFLGRGLNYVRADYVEANPDMDAFGMSLVDPCKIPDGMVAGVLQRCTSRQAMLAWGKLEKRPKVIAQIKARLNRAPTTAEDESAEA
jgi:hypothetical protein